MHPQHGRMYAATLTARIIQFLVTLDSAIISRGPGRKMIRRDRAPSDVRVSLLETNSMLPKTGQAILSKLLPDFQALIWTRLIG